MARHRVPRHLPIDGQLQLAGAASNNSGFCVLDRVMACAASKYTTRRKNHVPRRETPLDATAQPVSGIRHGTILAQGGAVAFESVDAAFHGVPGLVVVRAEPGRAAAPRRARSSRSTRSMESQDGIRSAPWVTSCAGNDRLLSAWAPPAEPPPSGRQRATRH